TPRGWPSSYPDEPGAGRGAHHAGAGRANPLPAAILLDVEILFTTLLVLAGIAILWFTVYVVYRLYADQR
ncbi:hypothetical protein ABZ215_26020, partial [Amycolatopsis sp. NPDC006131]|uniref:hypothetical protein n=1 Tax=Amycolatopsis sp. NPDC006131 TaxID=3156731 RepID=UPI0033A5FE17